jgi:hypothetical protein
MMTVKDRFRLADANNAASPTIRAGMASMPTDMLSAA